MGEVRRVALAFEVEEPSRRWGELLRGVARYAREAGSWQCGYRGSGKLAEAFREAVYLTPLMYCRIYRRRRGPLVANARPVEMVFIGPDGEPAPPEADD